MCLSIANVHENHVSMIEQTWHDPTKLKNPSTPVIYFGEKSKVVMPSSARAFLPTSRFNLFIAITIICLC